MASSEFKVNLFKYAGIDYDTGTMEFPGNITAQTITADTFVGNITSTFPSNANLDIVGNIIGNTVLSGNIRATGMFIGNGALLTGILRPLITTDIDIRGNVVTGSYANVSDIIATAGNIARVRFENGNVSVPGVFTTSLISSNVAGGYANVSNIVATVGSIANVRFENGNVIIPGAFTTSLISGNVVGGYANVTNIVATVGNIAGVRLESGNVSVPGALTASLFSGNVVGGSANVTNIVSTVGNIANVSFDNGNVNVPGALSARLFAGNMTGGYANVTNIVATVGNVANVRFDNGNVIVPGGVTAGIFVGNAVGGYANVSNIIATEGNIANVHFVSGNVSVPGALTASLITGNVSAQIGNVANVRFENGNVTVPGALNASLLSGNVVGGYANVSNLIAIVGNVANVMFENGNVSVPGTVSASLFLGNVSAASGNIGNVLFSNGDVSTLGNVSAGKIIGNVFAAYGNVANVRVENESIRAAGNVTAGFFVGNGALLVNLPGANIQGTQQIIDIAGNAIGNYANVVNVIATIGNVANVRFENGNILATGNIVAGLFTGNGAGLVSLPLPNLQGTIQTVDVRGNVIGAYANVSNVFANGIFVGGNIQANYFVGNGYYLTLNGLTLIPSGNVANAQQRLALAGVPKGTYTTEEDTGDNYILTAEPPSVPSNWLNFVGVNNVPSVFGRDGPIVAQVGDYTDAQVVLSATIGSAIANVDYVAGALDYLYNSKANVVGGNISANYFLGNVISTGNVSAGLFIGNGAGLTDLPFTGLQNTVQTISIIGNVIGTYANVTNIIAERGNVANVLFESGNVIVPGKVTAGLFVGNAAGLFDLPIGNIQGTIQPLDIAGNSIGAYANVSNIIATFGNIAGVRFANGNVTTTGNVSAGLFVGNGAGLTNISEALAGITLNIDVRGNTIGAYANVSNIIAVAGNVANVRFANGNITTIGNVSAGLFVGNGAGLTNIPDALAGTTLNIDVRGNAIGSYANVSNIIATLGNIANVRFENGNISTTGNVSAGLFVGNAAGLTNIPFTGLQNTVQSIDILGNTIGAYANVSNIIAVAGNIGTVLVENGNVIAPGTVSAGIFKGNLIGAYANVSNIISVAGNVGNVRFESGNVSIPGAVSTNIFSGNLIGAFANVSNIIAVQGNIGTVRMIGGNITVPSTATADLFSGNLIGAFANVANVIAVAGNIGNVRFVGGNVTAPYFIGDGTLLTNPAPPTFAVVSSVSDFLTAGSVRNRLYTGAATAVSLPNATTLPTGTTFLISSGQTNTPGVFTAVTNASGALVYNVAARGTCQFILTSNVSTAGAWVPVSTGGKNGGCLCNGRPVAAVNNGVTLLTYPTVVFDNLNQYNSSSGTFTAATDGYYTVTASLAFGAMTNGYFIYMRVLLNTGQSFIVNGNQVPSGYTSIYPVRGTVSFYMTIGQSFTVYYGQAGVGAHLNNTDTEWNYFSVSVS